MRRLFLQCFSSLLRGYHHFLTRDTPHTTTTATSGGANPANQHSPSQNGAGPNASTGGGATSFNTSMLSRSSFGSQMGLVVREGSVSSAGTLGGGVRMRSNTGRPGGVPFDSAAFVAWQDKAHKWVCVCECSGNVCVCVCVRARARFPVYTELHAPKLE